MKVNKIILEVGESIEIALSWKDTTNDFALPTLRVEQLDERTIKLTTWNGVRLFSFVQEEPTIKGYV